MEKKIVVLPGDGIGKEVVDEGIKVLDTVAELFGHQFKYEEDVIGGAALDQFGIPLREETLEKCQQADAVLLGAVGGPKWDTLPGHLRPEKALLGLRKGLGLFANLRPVEVFGPVVESSTLKREVVEGVDVLVVRELTGGIYFGLKDRGEYDSGEAWAKDECIYSVEEVRRIAKVAFEAARGRRKKVTSVDKANVLETSRLWREVIQEVHQEYPDIELEHMLVDNAAMQLVRQPKQFDVLVTENMFGDILSDEASVLAGSIGLMPSASLADAGGLGMYEPVHGTAPDIAGQGKANPLATILSCAMLLRYSFGLEQEADVIETAVKSALEQGWRTPDLVLSQDDPKSVLGTTEITNKIIEYIRKSALIQS
ncbi:3-isopropylmalate dehydrogenase [Bacillus horti]|uniref:3-isopropylmalate dehydrogenase n=1 Tax=Caldalkalibacillus horti TaxID=77523 RepID=A0ABT9W331_9BACI|nr:3-isopropylmalate dehydrogenase [Bacillus horti]MDQ0167250.1 3-isopropylmalate dehydrogenase [Bacillus horti]